jgi:hypothetical protein
MKKILVITILLWANLYAQNFTFRSDDWRSEWRIESVLNVGDEKCLHQWAKEDIREFSSTSCLVTHGSRGCPNNWGKEEWICELCLRDIIVSEDRIIIPEIERPKSKFELLKEKLKK